MSDFNKENKYNIIFVTTAQDNVNGSLRDAFRKANLLPNQLSRIIIKPLCVDCIDLVNGEIIVLSNIKLVNSTNKDLTIRATNNQRLFHVISPSIYFKIVSQCHFITLTNGSTVASGGAIYVEPSSHSLILKNVIITKNIAKRAGGGIYTQGNITLISSTIAENMANTQGGGIWSGGNTIMYESTVTKNLVLIPNDSNGGAGIFVDNGNCILDKSHVTYNQAAYDLTTKNGAAGGGIVVMSGNIFVQNSSHVDHNTGYNSAGIQGGIGNANVTNKSSISYNKSFNSALAAGGGGITITLGTVIISDSKITNNNTTGMFAGGIVSLVGKVVITDHSEISGNSNKGPGGGIAVNVGSVFISDSTISNNTGASLGGGIVSFTPAPLSIINSTIANNTLTNAQTIRQTIDAFIGVITGSLTSTSKQAAESGGIGGKTFIEQVPIILVKINDINNQLKALPASIISGNTIAGGAIACLLPTSITIEKSLIKCNFVGKIVDQTNVPFNAYGGGVFGFLAKISIGNSIIKNNKSLSEAGGIFSKTELLINHSKIIENKTKKNAGGVLIDIGGKAVVINSVINGNLAKEFGGGINNRGVLELISSNIEFNGADKNWRRYFFTRPICQNQHKNYQ